MRALRARRRNGAPSAPTQRSVATSVYECPECEARLLGERRCPDCNLFCRLIGPGGICPCCDEPVAIAELTDSTSADPSPGSPPV